MKLSTLIEAVQNQNIGAARAVNGTDPEITGISTHSSWVKPGNLFVMIRGYRFDGRRFAEDAVRQGACAVIGTEPVDGLAVPQYVVSDVRAALADLASEFYGEPSRALTCVGITGTNGKSTTAYLLSSIFRTFGDRPAMLGTLGHGIFGALLPAQNTTPDALMAQSLLRRFVEQGSATAIMEVSSHALDQVRVRGIHFDAAVFTNLSQDHLDYHPTLDEYRDTKARLFDDLSPLGIAVVNSDDPASRRMCLVTRARVVRYGVRTADVDYRAIILEQGLDGSRFEVRGPGLCAEFRTRLLGGFNVENCLAAIATAASLGVNEHAIRNGIEAVARVPGRLERVSAPGQPLVLVDYAHTDDALAKVLDSLRPHLKGRIITVFGAGGDRDASKRPRMGRAVAERSDLTILTSDNPRSEDPEEIAAQVREGIGSAPHQTELDRRRAIALAIGLAEEDDTVLIAGKGHETTQYIDGQAIGFDDREVAREILSEA